MTEKKKHPGGRPTKLTPKNIKKMEKLYRRGFTDLEVCEIIEIDESTLAKWKKKNDEFFKALKSWKIDADEKVEMSLYESACGWVDDDGKRNAPNPTSMIFWLKNRQPKKYRDKVNVETTGNITINIDKNDSEVL